MVIMKVNGYSNKLISAILTRIIVITAIIVMLFNCFITPYTVDVRSEIEHRIVHEQKIYSLRDKNFTISNDGSKVIYINNKNKLTTANVFIKSKNNEDLLNKFKLNNLLGIDYGERYIGLAIKKDNTPIP